MNFVNVCTYGYVNIYACINRWTVMYLCMKILCVHIYIFI